MLLTAVGYGGACGTLPSPPPADCIRAGGDSARAVCLALDTLARGERLPSRVWRFEQTAEGFRIVTVPADARMLDGMGIVHVTRAGRVTSVVVTDSA